MSAPEPEPRQPAANVLWGRVATAVVVILMAFGLGRCTADGVPEEEVAALDGQVAELQSSNDALRAKVEDLDQTLAEREATPTPAPATEPSAPAPTPGEGEPGGTHTVAPGDTLVAIAIDVYGDREMARMIAAANGIENSTTLQVGQVLELPPAQ